MPAGERALAYCRHWVAMSRQLAAAKAGRESHPVGGIVTGQPKSIKGMLDWSFSEKYMPKGSENRVLPTLHKAHSVTIGVYLKASGNARSALGDHPIRFWSVVILLFVIRGWLFHQWWSTWPIRFDF
jgi:hypothetical protein